MVSLKLVVLSVVALASGANAFNSSNLVLDVAVLLEETNVMGQDQYGQILNFVGYTMFPQFTLNSSPTSGVSGTMFTYGASNAVKQQFLLGQYNSTQGYHDGTNTIGRHWSPSTGAYLGAALDALKSGFSMNPANRNAAPDIVIIFAAQLPSDMSHATSVAQSMSQTGTTIIVINVGSKGGDQNSWGRIYTPSGGNYSNYLAVPKLNGGNALGMDYIINTILTQLYEIPFPCPLDIAFVLDTSERVNPSNFSAGKEFLVNVVNQLELLSAMGSGSGGHQVGVVTYGVTSKIQCPFMNTNNASISCIRSMKAMGGNSNIDSALNLVSKQVFSTSNGARANAGKLVIVVTWGTPSLGYTHPDSIAYHLRVAQGATIFGIGVGADVNAALAKEMSTIVGMNHNYVFSLHQASTLTKNQLAGVVVDTITAPVCHQGPPPRPNPTPYPTGSPKTKNITLPSNPSATTRKPLTTTRPPMTMPQSTTPNQIRSKACGLTVTNRGIYILNVKYQRYNKNNGGLISESKNEFYGQSLHDTVTSSSVITLHARAGKSVQCILNSAVCALPGGAQIVCGGTTYIGFNCKIMLSKTVSFQC